MSPTQIWMLCVILAMVVFMVISMVWGKNTDKDQKKNKK